ncbi:MAG: NAD(P)/FAD-dependent oxidoreductase [Acidimicrobiia bacterium]|nr:NAD(P)/FAD-dependent oxidoreductase [Acidimicrobiia bacterium]
MDRPRVVVIGAGFGGIGAGTRLARLPVETTIVDRRNHHVFQPLLYQVATAGLSPSDIALPVRGIFQDDENVDFRWASVERIDFGERVVHVDAGAPLPYDYLVLAAGSETRWFGIPGVQEHALPMKTLEDATILRGHVLAQFERAAAEPQAIDKGALTFVLVGGGPTGVELAGALVELFHVLDRDFHHLDVTRARVVLVEAMNHLLNGFTEKSQRSALDTLRARGVDVRLGQAVDRVGPGRVHLKGGEVLGTDSLIWAAGIEPAPLAAEIGLERGPGGRIVVGPDLRASGYGHVFVIGDLAAAADRKGRLYPQMASVALQQGHFVGRQVGRMERGKRPVRFRYLSYGYMATIGRNSAVAELAFHIRLRGFPGWLAWLVVHLVRLIGFRNRLSVLFNWAWSYATYDRGTRLIVHPEGRASHRAPASGTGTRPRP